MPRVATKPDPPTATLADLRQFTLAEVVEQTGLSRSAVIEKLRDPAYKLQHQRIGNSGTHAKYMFTFDQVKAIVASFTNQAPPAERKPQPIGEGERRVGKRY